MSLILHFSHVPCYCYYVLKQDKADSFFTTQRLNYIANQTELLRPKLAELKTVDIDEASEAVKKLETSAKNLLRSVKKHSHLYYL